MFLFYVVVVVCPLLLSIGRKHLTHYISISFFAFFVVLAFLALFDWVNVIIFGVVFDCWFFGHLDGSLGFPFSFIDHFTQHRYKCDQAFVLDSRKPPITQQLDIPNIVRIC